LALKIVDQAIESAEPRISMCGRYRRTTLEEELARRYHIPIPKELDLPISYNVAPSQKVLTIRFNPETGERMRSAEKYSVQVEAAGELELKLAIRPFS
jgi:hypothetical protein